jgi:preprotein translocase subunit Sss1
MAASGEVFGFRASEDAGYLVGDVVERLTPRLACKKAQKEEYSGKKKLHTNKNFAISRPDGYVLFLSETYAGSVHDKSIWNELQINIEEHSLLLDSGFEGADKQCPTVITPFKKPKGKELSESKKNVNTGISKKRAIIENVFEMIKRLRMIRDKIRIKGFDKRHLVMRIATGIHNLRIRYKTAI